MKKSSRIWSLASAASFIAAFVLSALFASAFNDVLAANKTIYELFVCVKSFPIAIFLLVVAGIFCACRNNGISLRKNPKVCLIVTIASTILLIIAVVYAYGLTRSAYWDFYENTSVGTYYRSTSYISLPTTILCWLFGLVFGFIVSILTNKVDEDSYKPDMPKLGTGAYTCFFFAFITSIFFFFLLDEEVTVGYMLSFMILLVFVIAPIVNWRSHVNRWKEDPSQYFEDEKQKQLEALRKMNENNAKMKAWNDSIEAQKKQQHIADKIPDCPNCGSYDVTRISTASRVTSIATVGLASGKIGKQYKCNKCKHMW